ncbi:MAG: SDR family oxidoreductase [Planctomycetes bacterium]|nr:SDR family oxidoreductase [Planctomycetota bacterium]
MREGDFSESGGFIVFGASGGIGSAVVRALSARDAHVVAAARGVNRLAALDLGSAVRNTPCDVTAPGQVEECFQQALEFGGGAIAGVALCVGSILLKPAHLTTDAEWDDVLARNLTAAFHVARCAGRVMQKGGSVVFCSTAAAGTGLANHDAIAAAKAGVEGLVRSAAATYAARGLRFNAVAPGLVRTGMSESITGNERALETSRAMHPLGRIGEPNDVSSAIVWLLDPANDWVTGHVLRVDGGLARLRPVSRR